MEQTALISRIRKLLNLANGNTNVHESASALAKAQELMDRHNIQMAFLEVETGETNETPIISEYLKRQRRVATWSATLASTIARANNCYVYITHGIGVTIVGEEDDVAIVRVMFNWIEGEIIRLCKQASSVRYLDRSQGRVFANNFKLGATRAVGQRFAEQSRKHREEVKALPNGTYALAVIGNKMERVRKALPKLGNAHMPKYRHNRDGYSAGLRAGNNISLSPKGQQRLRG